MCFPSAPDPPPPVVLPPPAPQPIQEATQLAPGRPTKRRKADPVGLDDLRNDLLLPPQLSGGAPAGLNTLAL